MRKFIFGMICAMFLSIGIVSCSNGATASQDSLPVDSVEMVDTVTVTDTVAVDSVVVAE